MSNGKGDKRRPKVIDNKQFDENWQRAFKNTIDAMCTNLKQEVDNAFKLMDTTNE